MSIPVYRLPTGVKCLSNKGKVYISGACGVVILDFASTIFRKGHMVVFLPYLTPYHNSIFIQAVLGVVLGYTVELNLKGIGYRVCKEQDNLIFDLGYSHRIRLRIPKNISIRFNKKTFSLMSANYELLHNFATTIRSYRFPDRYKGVGVLYANEIVKFKEGKKS